MKRILLPIAVIMSAVLTAKGDVTIDSFPDPLPDAFSVRVTGRVTGIAEPATYVFQYGTTTSYGMTSKSTSVGKDMFNQSSFTISSGLKPNTTYHMRIKAVGSVTKVTKYSVDKTFTTTAPVAVTLGTPMVSSSTIVEPGKYSYLQFNLNPSAGSYPMKFQFKRNNVNFGAAIDYGSFSINPVTTAHAGAWTCVVTNSMPSSATSNTVNVTVAQITKFPSSTIAAKEGGTITAKVTLTPANPSATYLWHTGGNPTGLPTDIGTVTGQGTSTLTISDVRLATQQDYYCDVVIGSETLTLRTETARIGLRPEIQPISAQSYRVAEPISPIYVSISDATSVSVANLPKGLKYNSRNSTIEGTPTTPTPVGDPADVVITAKNSNGTSTFTFPIAVEPLAPGIVGSWYAILSRNGDPLQLGGKLNLNVTPTGDATGNVTVGAATYKIQTKVVASLANADVSVNIPSLKSGTNPTQSVYLTINAGVLTGSVGSASVLSGTRSSWTATSPATPRGPFNCKFTPGSSELADPAYPHGHSLATITVTNLGAVTSVFHLSDNTQITAAAKLNDNGEVPMFVPLYSNKGSLLGTLTIANPNVAGTISWNKQSTTSKVAYKAGFSEHFLTCTGGLYVKPDAQLNQYFANLLAGSPNGDLVLHALDLSMDVTAPVTINLAGAGSTTTPGLTLKPVLSTGKMTGSVSARGTDPQTMTTVTKTATHVTLVIPGTNAAYGFFYCPSYSTVSGANPFFSESVELVRHP